MEKGGSGFRGALLSFSGSSPFLLVGRGLAALFGLTCGELTFLEAPTSGPGISAVMHDVHNLMLMVNWGGNKGSLVFGLVCCQVLLALIAHHLGNFYLMRGLLWSLILALSRFALATRFSRSETYCW